MYENFNSFTRNLLTIKYMTRYAYYFHEFIRCMSSGKRQRAFLWVGVPVKSYLEGRMRFVLQDLFHLNIMLSYTRKRLIIDLHFYHKLDYSDSGGNAKHVSRKIDGVNRRRRIISRWPSNRIVVIRFPPRNMHTMEYCRQQSPSLR